VLLLVIDQDEKAATVVVERIDAHREILQTLSSELE
jgi:hypothetical protein